MPPFTTFSNSLMQGMQNTNKNIGRMNMPSYQQGGFVNPYGQNQTRGDTEPGYWTKGDNPYRPPDVMQPPQYFHERPNIVENPTGIGN